MLGRIDPAAGSRSLLGSGAREMSDVDVAREFTRMIIAQRGHPANGRVTTPSDEMRYEPMSRER
jgi:flagellar hook protein FlgE